MGDTEGGFGAMLRSGSPAAAPSLTPGARIEPLDSDRATAMPPETDR
jgi:hypothetical protein